MPRGIYKRRERKGPLKRSAKLKISTEKANELATIDLVDVTVDSVEELIQQYRENHVGQRLALVKLLDAMDSIRHKVVQDIKALLDTDGALPY